MTYFANLNGYLLVMACLLTMTGGYASAASAFASEEGVVESSDIENEEVFDKRRGYRLESRRVYLTNAINDIRSQRPFTGISWSRSERDRLNGRGIFLIL